MKATGTRKLPKAAKIFTDRQEARDVFWDNYAYYKTVMDEDDVRVVNYYGVGGVGKSALIGKLCKELEEKTPQTKYALYDFTVSTDRVEVMRALRNKLGKAYGMSFPLFDLGLYTCDLRSGRKPESEEIRGFVESSPLLRFVTDAMDVIPVADIAAKLVKLADNAVKETRQLIKDLTERHKAELRDIGAETELFKLYDMLPSLLAKDLSNATKDAAEPLVIFLDTYETLVNELGGLGDPLTADLWLRGQNGLIQTATKVLWVIAGRDKLKWAKDTPGWITPDEGRDRPSLDAHRLGDLSESDAMGFLKTAGVEDEALRRGLYRLTGGTPVYLDLCVDSYIRLCSSGRPITPEQFGDTPEALVERYARYMPENKREIAYFLATLGEWDDKTAQAVAERAHLNAFTLSGYDSFKGLSFVSEADAANGLDQGFYTFHQLVGDVLRENTPQTLRDAVLPAAMDYCAQRACALNESDFLSGERSQILRALAGYAARLYTGQTLTDFYQEKLKESFTALYERGRFDAANRIITPLLDAVADSESEEEAFFLLEYSGLLRAKGAYRDAEARGKKALDLYQRLSGEDSYGALAAMNDLVISCSALGRVQEALELRNTVLEKSKIILGEDHSDTIHAMGNLAASYFALGYYLDAVELQQSVLEKQKAALGEDHPETLRAMNNLAAFYSALGRDREALELRKAVLDRCNAVLGEDHPETLAAAGNLALSFSAVGRCQEALDLQETVLKKFKAALGEDHPDTLAAMHNLAIFCMDLKRYQEAIDLQEAVLAKRNVILGEDHPDTLTTMNNLASSYSALGRVQEALDLQVAVLEGRRAVLGEDHPYTVDSVENLAKTYKTLGRDREVLELWQTTLDRCREVLGEDHVHTINAMHKLADCCFNMGQTQRALDLLQALLEKCRLLLGEDHPFTLSIMGELALSCSALGREQEALELRKEILEKSQAADKLPY